MLKILFRVDGNKKLGIGHIYRCLNLAKELKSLDTEIYFLMKKHEQIKELIKKSFEVYTLEDELEYSQTSKIIDEINPNIVITDLLKPTEDYLEHIKEKKVFLVSIDDLNEIKFCSDIVINGTAVKNYWNYDTNGKILVGPKYMILNKYFPEINQKEREIKKDITNILVSMGGSDPKNTTPKVINALNNIHENFKVNVVLGSAYESNKELKNALEAFSKDLEIKRNVDNMAELMFNCDLAITSAGIIVYELACTGTPAVVMSQVESQIETAEEMQKIGTLKHLGLVTRVTQEELEKEISNLIKNYKVRKTMSEKKDLVDGLGTKRVKEIILNDYKNYYLTKQKSIK